MKNNPGSIVCGAGTLVLHFILLVFVAFFVLLTAAALAGLIHD